MLYLTCRGQNSYYKIIHGKNSICNNIFMRYCGNIHHNCYTVRNEKMRKNRLSAQRKAGFNNRFYRLSPYEITSTGTSQSSMNVMAFPQLAEEKLPDQHMASMKSIPRKAPRIDSTEQSSSPL